MSSGSPGLRLGHEKSSFQQSPLELLLHFHQLILFSFSDMKIGNVRCGISFESLVKSKLINSKTGNCCVINCVLSTLVHCLNVISLSVSSNLLQSIISIAEIPGHSVHRCSILRCLCRKLLGQLDLCRFLLTVQHGVKAQHSDELCTCRQSVSQRPQHLCTI